ncbi:hypothetical protein MRB53_003986 [Persea americana]|uniref:Uncharacterized protein n=1 Tax=Persea americana TaxID=3435 RepID=A0ACC2MZ85_PERAE|nr:hypothetical protein MRB53_003986 [Persea americana]
MKDQCSVVGQCIYWDNLLTAKAMSGLVISKYWRLPTTWRYSVGSEREEPEVSMRGGLVGSHDGGEGDVAARVGGSEASLGDCCWASTADDGLSGGTKVKVGI